MNKIWSVFSNHGHVLNSQGICCLFLLLLLQNKIFKLQFDVYRLVSLDWNQIIYGIFILFGRQYVFMGISTQFTLILITILNVNLYRSVIEVVGLTHLFTQIIREFVIDGEVILLSLNLIDWILVCALLDWIIYHRLLLLYLIQRDRGFIIYLYFFSRIQQDAVPLEIISHAMLIF